MIGRIKNIPFLGRQEELSLIRERSLTDMAQLIEKILVTVSPPTKDLVREGYFRRILTVEDLIQ